MLDENTTVLPNSKVSDLPSETVVTPPQGTTEATHDSPSMAATPLSSDNAEKKADIPPDLKPKQSIVKIDASASIDQKKKQELRSEPRIHVKWHADAYIDGMGIYNGYVKDISMSGSDFFLDLNLQKIKSLSLRIHVPPLKHASEQRVIEVTARVVYTVYDGHEYMFHVGINFIQFISESDRAYLSSYIRSRIAN